MTDMGRFLSAPPVEVEVIVARDIFAARAASAGKLTGEYASTHARITLPESAMATARLKDGGTVEVSTETGMVVVTAHTGTDDLAWMPNGPWANALIPVPRDGSLPNLKAFRAKIRGTQESITNLDSLMGG